MTKQFSPFADTFFYTYNVFFDFFILIFQWNVNVEYKIQKDWLTDRQRDRQTLRYAV